MKVAIKVLSLVVIIFFFLPTFTTGCSGYYENRVSDFDVMIHGDDLDFSSRHSDSTYSGTYEAALQSRSSGSGARTYTIVLSVCILAALIPGLLFLRKNNLVQGLCAAVGGLGIFVCQIGIYNSLNRAVGLNDFIIAELPHYIIVLSGIAIGILGIVQAVNPFKNAPPVPQVVYQQPQIVYQPVAYPQYQVPTVVPVPMNQSMPQQVQAPQANAAPQMWSCYACGTKNPDDFGFCGKCGTKRGN